MDPNLGSSNSLTVEFELLNSWQKSIALQLLTWPSNIEKEKYSCML